MKILSLDGGGVKGALQARLVERMEDRLGFLSKVDLFAGTSIGGIQALALAAGVKPSVLVSLFKDKSSSIFGSRDVLDTLAGGADEYLRANFSQDPLRAELQELFGNKRLSDLKREVMVTTFDLARFRPVFLDRSDDWSCVDAALATSAAPTYMPVHMVRASGALSACVDGGVFANNPSERAVTFAHDLGARVVTLLSIGAGKPPYAAPLEMLEEGRRVLDWGIRRWIVQKPHLLLKLWFDGSESVSHYACAKRLGDSYVRVQPALPEDVDLADWQKVPMLIALADTVDCEQAESWIRAHWTK